MIKIHINYVLDPNNPKRTSIFVDPKRVTLAECIRILGFETPSEASAYVFYTVFSDFSFPLEFYGVRDNDVVTICPKIPENVFRE